MKDWYVRWNPNVYWRDTGDFLAYRDDLIPKTLQLVANWRRQKAVVTKANKNLAYLCSRLELLVEGAGAIALLPQPSSEDAALLAHDLADFLSILPKTDCWDVHGDDYALPGEPPPEVCRGCPLVGPVRGLSGSHLYYGCDALAFIGEKLVEWRAGAPSNPWPEPGVWYSAFETDRRRH
jgi:hypothetical protein